VNRVVDFLLELLQLFVLLDCIVLLHLFVLLHLQELLEFLNQLELLAPFLGRQRRKIFFTLIFLLLLDLLLCFFVGLCRLASLTVDRTARLLCLLAQRGKCLRLGVPSLAWSCCQSLFGCDFEDVWCGRVEEEDRAWLRQ
jgi:hypothetical protein